ncbi:VCBS domain-containing protein [Bradyrhizobium sp. 1]|uniref:VCBS domain-containing protein n=1 Tax=Bradyrhizobium sp. 1 TaxID=241591 RepID=UPI001FF88CFE|nr:VCBS domain-containing protein [Bradyrhizobium sp. 1]MCK1391869.1 VCBS domain-containing protein [Bradyrhizobium sp. 1]
MDGQGSRSPADVHVDSFTAKAHGHVPEGAVVVADPNLIFHGEYKRAGADLVVSHEGHEFVVHDYFRGDKRAAIASPDGAHLTGDIVNALTGHVQYAQAAGGIAAAQVIGHVTKLSGSATAVRNGVSVILNNGDNVEKGDVVSTGGDSTLGITFIDGTVFGLSSNARMVLNEMVYDPNGSNNSSLLSLVAGTITFVAGETAKHGDMKIDTPVATMGIRGTAVLNQINFVVPAGGGDPQPQVSFQVLVEPNGTTGSYILFDKVTLLPIATVNQAGQMIQISGGNVSITNALMSPDIQKLITDVFTLKFTDNNTNTKLTTNFTDTITQNGNIVFIKTDTGATATATFTNLNQPGSPGTGTPPQTSTRIPGPPDSRSLDLNGNVISAFALTERADTTGDTVDSDTVSGRITFVDQNLGDQPTVSVNLAGAPNYVYQSAGHQDVTGSLTALQKQDIAATQIQISVVAEAGNNNNGSAVWTYTIPDHVFDFLAAGETLTLTYMIRVNNNFAVNPESTYIPITITITGTNDKPVITTSVPTITFEGGTSVPGGPLTSDVPTSGTLTFKDVDLTDTHTVSVALTSATLPDGSVPPGPLALFQSAMSVAIAAGADSKGTGTGTINWSLADLPVYLADFIPKGEVLTLVYTVTVKDSQGAISQQTITVTITGTDAPAVVWIATDKAGAPSGGFWKDAANWETGTVPTINDDVIVITDQLHGLTPSYPVTIDAAAYAKSITMNDFGGPPPKVINQSSLTISGALNMGADSIFINAATGTMSVGGKAEILDTAVFTNAGYLTLAGGGDFASGTAITNSGTIELSGGTLKTLATIHNAGGTLKADASTTLIVDTAMVDGGTVTILGTLELDGTSLIENGALNNSGMVNVKGATEFAHETVSNTSSGTIKVLANGWLTIDHGSSVTNTGNVTVDATGKLTVNASTISGAGTVTGDGEIELTGNAVLSGGTLKNNASIEVSGTGNALDGETVTNASAGTIEVLTNGVLTIDQGSVVTNIGNVTVDASSKLTVNGATISGAGTVTDNGEIDLTGNAVLSGGVLKNNAAFKVSGTGNALHNETITNSSTGAIEVLADGALTIDQGSTVDNFGNVTVDASGKLTVNGATISGAGTVTDNGEIDLTGSAVLNGGVLSNNAAFKVSGAGNALHNETITNSSTGTIEVLANGALTIDQGSDVTNAGNVTVDASGKLTVNGVTINGAGTVTDNGEIDLTGNAVLNGGVLKNNAAFKVSGIGNALDNEAVTNSSTGKIEVLANGALTIDQGSVVTNTGNVTVDITGKLTVSGATISGTGTVTDDGEIDLAGNAVLSGGVLKNNASLKVSGTGNALDSETVTNAGTIEVLTNGALTIDQGSTVNNSTGNLVVDGNAALRLDHATISGGAVKGTGTIDVTGASKIDGGATVSISTITADAALTLDGVTVSGTDITDKSSVAIASTVQLKDGATIQGASGLKGAVNNNGTLEIAGAATLLNDVVTNTGHVIKIDDGKTLTLSGTEIDGGTINNYSAGTGGTIDVTGDSKIGGNATLNHGAVTVESGYALTFGDATVAGTAIANHGAVNVETSKKLTLNDASLTGGALTVSGTLDSTGTTTVTNAGITNNGLIEALGGLLTLAATTSATIANAGTLQAKSGELDINGEAVTNTGTLAAINNGTLKLIGMTVTNTVGTVSVESGSTLDLNGATIDGGTVTIAGTLESIGTSAINNGNITNTGTITVTSGTLTIDPAVQHTITNSHLIQANGGELDISGDLIVNTADIKAINHGTLKLAGVTITNGGGAVTVDATSKLYLSGVSSINGGSLTNAGNLYSVSGNNSVSAGVTNTGTIEVQTGTLNLSGGIAGAGTLVIDDTATLELGGANAQTVTFAGGTNTLQLDKTSHDFSGTVTGAASTGGTFNVTGAGNITTSKGDALDFTASGGSSGSHGNIVLTPTGALTGATNGIVVTQNGIGDISLTTVGDITGQSGNGIVLHDGATGAGDITATIGGGVSGAVGLDVVSHGAGGVTITNNGHIAGTTSFGINVDQDDAAATGSTHITNTGSVIGADGVAAISIQENAAGTATIDNSGTIGPGAANVASTTSAIVETGGEITINNTGHINGNISVATATFNNGATGTWTVSGSGVFGDASSIINHGEIDLHGASISGTGLSIDNYADIDSWGTASISGTITNAGTIEVHDGDLVLFGSLTGTGSVTVDSGALLKLEGTVTQTINLAGDGAALEIDTSTFGGSIGELSATDTIDLSTIKFGLHTSAVYVANADAATGGVLTVTGDDGHTISLKLTGADYSHAHFAGTDDGTGNTLITIHADDDAPAFTDGGVLAASVSERADATGDFVTLDASTPATGATNFTDIDLTDLPTAQITGQAVTSLGADHLTDFTASLTNGEITALKNGLTLLPQTGLNNGTVTWSYSIADGKLDFLGQDQTAKIVSTVTLTDDYGKTATTDVTITITGKNDAPTLAGVSTDPLADTAANDSFLDITGMLVGTDADHGETASLHYAVLDTHDQAVSTLAGHYGSLTVNSDGTYDYVPDAAAINALSEGNYTETFTVQTTDAHGATGTAVLTVNVTGANDAPTLAAVSTDPLVDTAASDSFADITGTLVGTDADSGETAGLTYAVLDAHDQAVSTLAGHYGSLTVNSDGSYDYVPDAAAVNALSEGNYPDIFTVQTKDAHGATGAAVFTVNVTGANDAPTLAAVSTDALVDTAASDSFADLTGTLVGTDADTGETAGLTYAVLDAHDQAVSTLAGHYGSLTVNSDGTYDYVPDAAAINALSEGNYTDIFTVQTKDAHGTTGTAVFTVNVTGANDAPTVTAASGDSAGATLPEANAGLDKTGTLTLSDADTTDHVGVALDHVSVHLNGILQTDDIAGLSNADLLHYFTVPSGDILNGTADHGQFTWEFNSGSQAFDFLAAGQTLSLQYTIVPDDGHAATGTGNGVVTVTIAGSNDSPTLDNTTLDPVAGNASDPTGAAISDLFANKFHDADANAGFTAIAVTGDSATSDQGVWQYEIAGSDQWVEIAGVSDTNALVLSTDTLVRFVPANGFSGTPGSLGVHALDNSYAGALTAASPVTADITSAGIGHGGTTPVSDQAASVSIDVTVPPDVLVANDDALDNATPPSTDAGWTLDTENGHYYRLVTTELSWDDAKAQAESDGAYLATITGQGEQDIVQGLSAGYRAWIGGGSTDDTDGSGAHFSWLTGPESGLAFGYTHWRLDSNEPNGGSWSSTQYVHIEGVDDAANGGWNDAPGDAGGRYFIEEWGGQDGQVAFKENVGTTLTMAQLLANDTDSAGNPITVTSVGGLSGQSAHGGTVSLNGNIITYTPAADYFGSDSFAYTISDGIKTSSATVSFSVDQSPVIDTTHFVHTHNGDNSDTVTDLSVSGSSTETYSLSAVTAGAADGSSVSPSQHDGLSLDDVNSDIASVIYAPGCTPPVNDMITFTVTDSHGGKDIVNFIFSEGGEGAVSLTGTAGKDVIFASETSDTLTGGAGNDQFVFAPTSSRDTVQHAVNDFEIGLDKIDLRQFTDISSWTQVTALTEQQGADTLLTLDDHDKVLLKNTVAGNLHASDFILHVS